MSYRPTAKTRARQKAQHESLLKTAVSIVARDGFHGLTISRLARETGIATGTVYKYFDSKAHLCAEVFRRATEREVDMVRAASFPDQPAPCRQRLTDAVTIFAERAILGGRLAYALIAEPVAPAVEQERLIYRKAYAGIFEQLIEEGVETNEFPDQSPSVSAAALVGILAEVLVAPLGRGDAATDQSLLIDPIRKFCLRAIALRETA
ncbi:MAG: TetR/AcrR family transcriptional regulator [Alphaproteobacteria bacterium]|nr:TetR/AcrR family transcriptional regulator [Alphaproteobacteria bacterium]